MPTQDELARQLIDLVRQTTAPEATLLRARIDATLAYLADVVDPNPHTVTIVRSFLTGERDSDVEWWIKATTGSQE